MPRGVELSYRAAYLFDTRLAMGLDFFDKQTNASSYQSYASSIYGGNLRFGVPLTDTLVGSVRYSSTGRNHAAEPAEQL